MSRIPPDTAKNSMKLTAQQWAWQFLRRNLEYREAWTFVSSLRPEQAKQLGHLIEMRNKLLIDETVIDLDVVRTLDLHFFDQSRLSEFEPEDTTVGAYLDRISECDDFDLKDMPPVSNQFQLQSYCLKNWIDPYKSLDIDATTAAGLWAYEQYLSAGLEHAPWIDAITNVEDREFRPLQKPGRIGKGKERKIGTAGPIAQSADGNFFIRSPTIWGHDYKVPELQAAQVDIRFDLTMPIEFQIRQAKDALKTHHSLLSKGGFLPDGPKSLDKNGLFQEYVDVLDRRADGATPIDIVRYTKNLQRRLRGTTINKRTKARVRDEVFFDPNDKSADQEKLTGAVRQKIVRALRLRDHGYKALAFM